MAFRQVESTGFSENVFVDDRCPTIWQAPRFNQLPPCAAKSPVEASRRQREAVQATQPRRDVALLSTKVKPIQGDLLRKLFKATVEEKKRAAVNTGEDSPRSIEEAPRKHDVKEVEPPGFRLPSGVGTPRPRVQKRSSAKPLETSQLPSQPTTPTAKEQIPVPSTSTPRPSTIVYPEKTDSVRISDSHGEEALVETPVSPRDFVAVEQASPVPPLGRGAETVIPATAEEFVGNKKNKKQNRKNKKAQAREQEQLAKQAGVDADFEAANGKVLNSGVALMSGALPGMSAIVFDDPAPFAIASTARSDGPMSDRSHSSPKVGHAMVQPTVQSIDSRHSSRMSKASRAALEEGPQARTIPTRQPSFVSFEEVGDAWIGPLSSHIGAALSSRPRAVSSASLDEDGYKELGRNWVEAGDQEKRSAKYSPPPRVPSIHTTDSSWQASPQVTSELPLANGSEALGEIETLVRERRSTHSSARAASRSSVEMTVSVKDSSMKTRSGVSSPMQSSMSRVSKHESRHGNSPVSVRNNSSSKSSLSRSSLGQQLDTEEPVAGLQQGRHEVSKASTLMGMTTDDHESTSTSSSQPTSEKVLAESEHSRKHYHSSRRSARHSRHASTRSFSPRHELWEGPNLNSISTRSGAGRSSASHHQTVPVINGSKHSKFASLIGSVASIISRVRPDLTFEEIGEGWHDGGVPSDELKRIGSEVNSSMRASRRDYQHTSGSRDEVEDAGLERIERTQAEKSESRSSAHSQPRSSVSKHRSRHRSMRIDQHASNSYDKTPKRSRSSTHKHTLVGAPVHAVVSTGAERSGIIISQQGDSGHTQEEGRPHQQRPTVFAGKGWITPHPLESSVTERAPAIVLPSHAHKNGATLSYEEWKTIQEDGLRHHRNFSVTESDKSDGKRHRDERYRFSGWEAQSWQEVEPPSLDPNIASAHMTSNREAPAVRTTGSEPTSERSGRGPCRSQRSSHGRTHHIVSPSEHAWERMEEGRSHREDSVVSGKSSVHAYSECNEPESRPNSRHR